MQPGHEGLECWTQRTRLWLLPKPPITQSTRNGFFSIHGGSDGKEPACQCRRCGLDPWMGKIPWKREWFPTPIFLPGEVHGQRSLAGYSPWGHKELDVTERLTLPLFTCFTLHGSHPRPHRRPAPHLPAAHREVRHGVVVGLQHLGVLEDVIPKRVESVQGDEELRAGDPLLGGKTEGKGRHQQRLLPGCAPTRLCGEVQPAARGWWWGLS